MALYFVITSVCVCIMCMHACVHACMCALRACVDLSMRGVEMFGCLLWGLLLVYSFRSRTELNYYYLYSIIYALASLFSHALQHLCA